MMGSGVFFLSTEMAGGIVIHGSNRDEINDFEFMIPFVIDQNHYIAHAKPMAAGLSLFAVIIWIYLIRINISGRK